MCMYIVCDNSRIVENRLFYIGQTMCHYIKMSPRLKYHPLLRCVCLYDRLICNSDIFTVNKSNWHHCMFNDVRYLHSCIGGFWQFSVLVFIRLHTLFSIFTSSVYSSTVAGRTSVLNCSTRNQDSTGIATKWQTRTVLLKSCMV